MKRVLSKQLTVLAVVGATLGAGACTDLSENPVTEITEENFNPTEADLAALLGGVYTNMRGWFMGWYGYVDVLGEVGDILVTPQRPNGWVDGGVYRFRHEHSWTTTRGAVDGAWGRSYALIVEANRLINQIETGFVPLTPDTEQRTIAEIRALRAFAYTFLLDWFGSAPISTDFTDTELPEQASRQELYDFVVSELEATIPELSETTGTAIYGRINKWAALGILARVKLNAEVYTGTPAYQDVIALTDQIINSGNFQLASDYRSIFSRTNHTSSEMIWGLPYDAVSGTGSNFHMKTLKPELQYALNLNAQPWGGSAANPQFIDSYDEDDSRLEDSWLMGPVFSGEGRGYTFVQHVPGISSVPGDIVDFGNGFPVWKYEIYAGMTGSSDVDYPILRYAEVLMMKAEALLRTGDAGGAAALVTQVRQRAFQDNPGKAVVTGAELMGGSRYNYGWYHRDGTVRATSDPNSAVVTNGGADIPMGRFLDELAWEFAAEAHRRQQLIRFGVFTTKSWFNHESDVVRLGNADHLLLFPIPQGALDENDNLTQNPGY
jgi:starch-binding outer membrane protein, SusD/RagB family